MTKRLSILIVLLLLFIVSLTLAQQTSVTARAINQANLRTTTAIEAEKVGEIFAGVDYPVIGRSEFFPWLLLGDPATFQPLGWVFADLVIVTGNLTNVPFSTLVIIPGAVPTETLLPTVSPAGITPQAVISSTPAAPTATQQTVFNVSGIAKGEINVRYGPGADFQRLGVAQQGERFEITAQHTQFPWLQVRYEASPNGYAWIAVDLLDIEGDLLRVPPVSQTFFDLPTLTPTSSVVQSSSLLTQDEIPLSSEFASLGDQLWNIALTNGFDPVTNRFGALFLLNLESGEAISFGSQYAFSGISVSKIAILVALYSKLNVPPDMQLATDIAHTMICSDNSATNRLLGYVGSGDEYLGAEEVTRMLRQIGLTHTFLTAPYEIPGQPPALPPRPIQYPVTGADQLKANSDLTNQLTVDEMGWLLGSIYECGYGEGGPLVETFPGLIEPRECRQMLHVMSSNTVDALLKTGVPAETRVGHKHGWIDDTHGNAAVFFTPGGDYVLVMMMHQPEWLDFSESLPVMAEISRNVYNYFNPDAPQEIIRDGFIPDVAGCNYTGSQLVLDLMSSVWER